VTGLLRLHGWLKKTTKQKPSKLDIFYEGGTITPSTPSHFQNVALFADLQSAVLQKLDAVAWLKTYHDAQIIMLEGEQKAPVFFIVEGTARAFRANPEGREQTLIHLHSGDGFNIPTAFSRETSAAATVIAVGTVKLLGISPQDFRRVVSETPEIALAVLGNLSDKLRHFTTMTHDLSLRSVRGRLAKFILAQYQGKNPKVRRWTQEEIAAQIGTVREVVSRTLRAFVRDNLIEMKRQHIIVLDPEGLKNETEV